LNRSGSPFSLFLFLHQSDGPSGYAEQIAYGDAAATTKEGGQDCEERMEFPLLAEVATAGGQSLIGNRKPDDSQREESENPRTTIVHVEVMAHLHKRVQSGRSSAFAV
jgi:hypothetical protein